MNIVEIPLSDLDNVWNLVKKDIAQALAYSGNYTDSDFVLEQLKQKKFQLWVLWDKTKQTTIDKYSFFLMFLCLLSKFLDLPPPNSYVSI